MIFSYIRDMGQFLGFKILFFSFFFRKMNIFLGGGGGGGGEKILWIFFGVITKLDYIKESLLCILGSFLKVNVRNGDIFWAAKIYK